MERDESTRKPKDQVDASYNPSVRLYHGVTRTHYLRPLEVLLGLAIGYILNPFLLDTEELHAQ